MKTLKEQTEAKVAAGRQGNPAFMQGIDDAIAQARAVKDGENALKVGQLIPSFELPSAKNGLVSSSELLAKGPVIVTFYRGSWCPYCNLQLRALQGYLSEIKAAGAELVAITPQVPDDSMSEGGISAMDFIVLSDQDAKVAEQFGVAWKVPEFVLNHMKVDRGLDLESINNGNGAILPIPATYVVGTDGVITWHYVDVDYRTRSEPSDVIEALKLLV